MTQFLIEEVLEEGQGRTLVLSGAGMPTQGAAWGGENVVVTTFYPGNTVDASQQVLGPKEAPSSFAGEWHINTLMRSGCKLYGDGDPVNLVYPNELKEVLEDIFRTGHLLRVVWESDGHRELRYGRAVNWNFAFDRAQDIKWTASFAWKSRGESKKPTVTRGTDVNSHMNSTENSYSEALEKYKKANAHLAGSSNLSLGHIAAFADIPSKLVGSMARQLRRWTSTLQQAGQIVSKMKRAPFAMMNSVVDTAANTVAITNQFKDEFTRMPPELKTQKSRASDIARAVRTFGEFEDAVDRARERALTLHDAVRRLIETARKNTQVLPLRSSSDTRDIIAVHVAKIGDTPEKLSMRYYKSPDHGTEILRANRMPWHQVTFKPGTPLIIPRFAPKNTSTV